MGLDGMIRPSQAIPQTDVMNPHTAVNRAHADNEARPLIRQQGDIDKAGDGDGTGTGWMGHPEGGEETLGQSADENPETRKAEAGAVSLPRQKYQPQTKVSSFWGSEMLDGEAQALFQGVLHHAGKADPLLLPDRQYRFHSNPASDCIDLMELETGRIVLQLTPEEVLTLSHNLHRGETGLLADRAG